MFALCLAKSQHMIYVLLVFIVFQSSLYLAGFSCLVKLLAYKKWSDWGENCTRPALFNGWKVNLCYALLWGWSIVLYLVKIWFSMPLLGWIVFTVCALHNLRIIWTIFFLLLFTDLIGSFWVLTINISPRSFLFLLRYSFICQAFAFLYCCTTISVVSPSHSHFGYILDLK